MQINLYFCTLRAYLNNRVAQDYNTHYRKYVYYIGVEKYPIYGYRATGCQNLPTP